MGRWTQFDEDSYRLPEGMKRVAYDADTSQYTFRDREGNMFIGPVGADYGVLTPMNKSGPSESADRPDAFATGQYKPKPNLSVQVQDSGSTFHDFLPPHLITSPSSANSTLSDSPFSGGSSASARFRNIVRHTALPAMQNVANNVRRSTTSARKPPQARDQEKDSLLRRGSQVSSTSKRSQSSATSSTLVSFQSVDEKAKS
ncbi:hypothetical protein B0H10DRAFT_1909875 [Mycena sp. CBHHK59/15]|nr:hypothetical protein B0H10DRAFT_1909875 [Mycena sp. CBHHK59/15]